MDQDIKTPPNPPADHHESATIAPDSPLDHGKQGNALYRWFSGMSAKGKCNTLVVATVGVFLILSLVGYEMRESSSQKGIRQDNTKPKVTEIDMDKGLIEKSLYTAAQNQIQQQNKQIQKIAEMVKQLKENPPITKVKTPAVAPSPSSSEKASLNGKESGKARALPLARMRLPPPPPDYSRANGKENFSRKLFGGKQAPPPPVMTIKMVGGIDMESVALKDKKPAPKLKKKQRTVYLPPSFMEATLLSGVEAPTTSAGKNNPLPVLLRVKYLAVLPNKVKANLKGCFVIGEGIGNLADERVHIRLDTLSCVAKNGGAVIDQKVEGFVVDEDGKVGLKGNVVAKMGVNIARAALAGFIGGIGDAMNQTSMTTSLGALGQTTSLFNKTDTNTLMRAGIGQGIASAAKNLQKFYLQLAQQTLPVIEVGATKTVTLVISQGTGLTIKNQNVERR